MTNSLYRETILEHWQHPQNYGVLKNPDIDVEENNPFCGDIIRLTIKLENNKAKEVAFTPHHNDAAVKTSAHQHTQNKNSQYSNRKVVGVGFTGEGCAISKASASLFTEEIKNKTITELKAIKSQEVLDLLGVPLSPTRAKCALLIHQVLQKGLTMWSKSQK